jgi:Ca-activated chloride channel family protein
MGISFVYPNYLWFLLLVPITIGLALLGRQKTINWRFWSMLALRTLVLLGIILALSGMQLHLESGKLTTVFVLDVSDSISAADRTRGEEFIRQSIAAMPGGDEAAVVLFGEEALVERLAQEERHLAEITSVPVTTRTDIAEALQLAMALFPNEGAKRVLLLSDGRENVQQAVKQAEVAALQGVELSYLTLGEQVSEAEVQIESLKAPTESHFGQDFDLEITLHSTVKTGAELQVFGDGSLIHSQEVGLQPGNNVFSVTIADGQTGFHRYSASIVPDADKSLQNNEASAFTVIQGPPNILIVEGSSGEAANLREALEAAEMRVTTVSPGGMPTSLAGMAAYDVVVLANVPAPAIPAASMEALPVFVRDLGRGLLTLGGDQAYGAGGYLRTPLEEILPVTMDVKSKNREVNLALVLAVDKSGSMGRCHCDNPDLNQTYVRREVGQPKVDIAKEAIMRSANALGGQDYLGVVSFDSQAHWALELGQLPEQSDLENAIGRITANGQTNVQSGMQAAYEALKNVEAGRRHVIMLTDGWTHSGDLSGLVNQMNKEGITVSFVAAGNGSAEYLHGLADLGGGRYYAAKDMLSVPDIFLKETVQSVGQYIIEEPFYPLPGNISPLLRGLDDKLLPGLQGYNGTTARQTARLDLLTPRGDPLLATWQFGLGKSAAWTSDLKGQWATEWVEWDKFPRFAAQTISWLLPASRTPGMEAAAEVQDEGVSLQLDVSDDAGHALNNLDAQVRVIGPDLKAADVELKQTAAGHYEVLAGLDEPGVYLLTFSARDDILPVGQTTLGLVVPYSPEYRSSGVNTALLDRLAEIGGGGALTQPDAVFVHNLDSQRSAREIWQTLLLVAALLFPLDVAVRRLNFTKHDWQEMASKVEQKLHPEKAGPLEAVPRMFGNLFTAAQRGKARQTREVKSAGIIRPIPNRPAEEKQRSAPQAGAGGEDSFSRLREAKKRARR